MSETTPTFKEAKGTEANQQAKKLAQEKSKKKKSDYPVLYTTTKKDKVLSLKFKPNGVYRTYVGSLSKKNADSESLKAQIKIWEKKELLIRDHEIADYAAKFAKNGYKAITKDEKD